VSRVTSSQHWSFSRFALLCQGMLAVAIEFAMAGRQLAPLRLREEARSGLESLASRRKTAEAVALRVRIALACAEGAQNKDVAAKLSLDSECDGRQMAQTFCQASSGRPA
jgi:hypothetical protein